MRLELCVLFLLPGVKVDSGPAKVEANAQLSTLHSRIMGNICEFGTPSMSPPATSASSIFACRFGLGRASSDLIKYMILAHLVAGFLAG